MGYLEDNILFAVMIAVAVFMTAWALLVPVFGENKASRKRLMRRVRGTARELQSTPQLLRAGFGDKAYAWERKLQRLPGFERLAELVAQAGTGQLATRVAGSMLALCVGTVLFLLWLKLSLWVALPIGLAASSLPILGLRHRRDQRVLKFDEQLPDAIGVMIRGLRAGHPFPRAIQLVGQDMPDPVGFEFRQLFADINYGADVRRALFGLVARVPSVTTMALVTAVLVQRETGGNLAEVLERIASVVRGRFRFQRKVKTLSAEARMSAWILTLFPFVLFGLMSILNPEYMPHLIKDPMGRQLIGMAFVLMVIGAFWMRHLVRIRV